MLAGGPWLRLVHDTSGAAAVKHAVTAVLAGAVLIAAAAGCGDDSSGDPPVNVGGPAIGVRIELADCQDWRDATVEERLGTIAQIRNFAGSPSGGGGRGAILDDGDAYDVMENACANDFAHAFKLYKLYTRAAAFSGH